MIDIASIFDRLPRETARTLVEQARVTTPGLEQAILQRLTEPRGSGSAVMPEALLEGAFPWLSVTGGWEEAAKVLQPATIELLKQASHAPFVHQLKAWKALRAEEPKSVIVSSGTGSGKTECFLTPVTDHLLAMSNGGTQPLTGVRAIMLYPLNALINSQEERLTKLFSPFNGNLRYCLYNGATPNREESAEKRRATPEKVLDRPTLRRDPPPVLVTNITMLEYMLVRQDDAPILNRSRGTLDYIILDEAHTYVGAKASELSLLLRRVAAAFGKSPEELRYVATSATIGDGSGEALERFLSDVAGVDRDRVEVITGERAPLRRKGTQTARLDLDALVGEDPAKWTEALFEDARLSDVRERLRSEEPVTWSEWERISQTVTGGARPRREDAVKLLDLCARTRDEQTGEQLLPVRLHLFHKTLPGVWACPNSSCQGRPADMPEWPYGALEIEDREHCRHCGSVVFEWVSCRSCGDGALLAAESHDASRIERYRRNTGGDDFFQELAADPQEDEAEDSGIDEAGEIDRVRRYLVASSSNGRPLSFYREDGRIADVAEDGAIDLVAVDTLNTCPHCEEKKDQNGADALTPVHAGAPYLVRQLVPAILPALTGRKESAGLPMGGRSLITFTDARQGTAQHAAALQLGSEREFVRGFIYHAVQRRETGAPEEIEEIKKNIAGLKSMEGFDFSQQISDLEQKLRALSGETGPKSITNLIGEMARHRDVRDPLYDLWSARSESLDSPEAVAEFLLLRELARRPKWAASGETLGLFRVVPPPKPRSVPAAAERVGMSAADWEKFLQICITHYFRQNQMLEVNRWAWLRYAGIQGGGRAVVRRYEDVTDSEQQKVWPSVHRGAERVAWVRLLSQAYGLPFEDSSARDVMEDILDAAFQALCRMDCIVSKGVERRLDWTKLYVERVGRADICPVTRLPLQASLNGRTIYRNAAGIHEKVATAEYPQFPFPDHVGPDGSRVEMAEIDTWLAEAPDVADLRSRRLWDNRTDRAVRFEGYYRAAEHSAQLFPKDLRRYEDKFKAGEINVLSCSTTMEMGVDIGDIEAVLNTNAPPAVANYKQRMGRAGRREQSLSLGITICKDRPLDREVAADPVGYFNRVQSAPRVSLESSSIVQRHVNAWLLSEFMNQTADELLSSTVGGFFCFTRREPDTPIAQFLAWLDDERDTLASSPVLAYLVKGTRLSAGAGPVDATQASIAELQEALQDEWDALSSGDAEKSNGDDALSRKRSAQRKRLEEEYLLSALSGRGFLPAYGFPTGVVQFWIETSEERRRREHEKGPASYEDRRFLSRGMPSRQRNIGIFEFAPGSEIVIDGLLRRSSGVTLNWQRPISDQQVKEVQSLRTVWFCRSCAAVSSRLSATDVGTCSACGSGDLKEIRYLAPSGFSIDPSDKVSDQRQGSVFTPRPPSIVGATGAAWRPLPEPEAGRVRTSADGLVFDRNDGPNSKGYAICLECGRAAPEEDNSTGELPNAMREHKPLHWTPKAGPNEVCPGATQSYSIQRNISLGDEFRTTVFELQLAGVRSDGVAVTVAMALREVVAKWLGIEPNEMGVAASQTLDQKGRSQWTAAVFDSAVGGAGFATQIGEDPIGFISDAANLLDCGRPGGCGDSQSTRICPNCVLRADVQNFYDVSDRKAAYEALEQAKRRLALPDAYKVFGADSRYLATSIPDTVRLAVSERLASELWFRATGPLADWDLEEWAFSSVLQRTAAGAGERTILADRGTFEKASEIEKIDLALWCAKHGVAVAEAPDGWPEEAAAISSTETESRWWGARDLDLTPGASWSAAQSPAVFVDRSAWHAGSQPIDTRVWLTGAGRESIRIIHNELDGPVSEFGTAMRSLIGELTPELAPQAGAAVKRITITDRYIFNPFAVRMYTEICKVFGPHLDEIAVRTLSDKPGLRSGPSLYVFHDWEDIRVRDKVLSACLGYIADDVKIDRMKRAPHGRFLEIETDDDRVFKVVLDQGVGAWRSAPQRFDFTATAERQAVKLHAINFLVMGPADGTYLGLIR